MIFNRYFIKLLLQSTGVAFCLLLAIHYLNIDKLYFSNFTSDIPADIRLKSTVVLSAIFLFEYMPVVLFFSGILFGKFLKSSNIINFFEIKGIRYKRKVFFNVTVLYLLLMFACSYVINFTIPSLFDKFQEKFYSDITTNIITSPENYLTTGRMVEAGNYTFFIGNLTANNGKVTLRDVSVFSKSYFIQSEPHVYRLTECSQVIVDKYQKIVHYSNCLATNLKYRSERSVYAKNGFILFEDLKIEIMKSIKGKELYVKTPEYMHYFTRSAGEILESVQGKICPPSEQIFLVSRLLYLFAFITYSLFGLYIAIHKSFKPAYFYLFIAMFGIILPHIGIYFSLMDKYGLELLAIPYFLPILGSVAYFLNYKFKIQGWFHGLIVKTRKSE